MQKFVKVAGLAATALLATTILASAADLRRAPPPVYVPPPPPPVVYNWSGFYLGVNGGYGWGDSESTNTPFNITGMKGGFAGGEIGFNAMMAPGWLWGIAADAEWSAITGSVTNGPTVDQDVNWFGTVRGVIGMPMGNILPYFTGGFAWANETRETTIGGNQNTQTHTGYVLGGGLAVALSQNVSAKVEYQYINLGAKTYNLGFISPNADTEFSTIRVGLDFHM